MSMRKCSMKNIDGKKIVVPNEYDECKGYYQWTQLNPLTRGYVTKILNEGKRDPKSGAFLKAIGMQKGYPDYFISVPNDKYHGLFIEMKRIDGKEKPKDINQISWINKLNGKGYCARFCYGSKEAIELTIKYLNNTI